MGERSGVFAVIEVRNLQKVFHSGMLHVTTTKAVDDVSFSIQTGKTLGLAGMSGSGKSTIARILMRLIPCDSGVVLLDGQNVLDLKGTELKEYRKKVQMIFQNPTTSLNPSKKLSTSMVEPLQIHGIGDTQSRAAMAVEKFHLVGLDESLLMRYPHQISGGEAQRTMIARTLMLQPSVLILDEPTSMLDVSIQAQILTLLKQLQQELNMTYLMISHDFGVLSHFCDDIAVMNQGRIIEYGSCDQVMTAPSAQYTAKLIGSYRDSRIWQ